MSSIALTAHGLTRVAVPTADGLLTAQLTALDAATATDAKQPQTASSSATASTAAPAPAPAPALSVAALRAITRGRLLFLVPAEVSSTREPVRVAALHGLATVFSVNHAPIDGKAQSAGAAAAKQWVPLTELQRLLFLHIGASQTVRACVAECG